MNKSRSKAGFIKEHWLLFCLFVLASVNSVFGQQDTITLQEVEVKNLKLDHTPASVNILSKVTLSQTSAHDLGSVMRMVPNVSGIKKGASGVDPVIRGFKYAQLNVLLDGSIKIEGGCPNRMDPTAAHVDINEVKEMEILKGPYALKYGPSFGGVINLVTWQPDFHKRFETHVNGMTGWQSNGLGTKNRIAVEGGNRFLSFQLSGGYKKYTDYKDGAGHTVPANLSTSFLKGDVAVKLSPHHLIHAGVDVSQGWNIDFPALAMDEREDRTRIYKFNYLGSELGRKIRSVSLKTWYSGVHHVMDNKNRGISDTIVAVSTIDAVDAGLRSFIRSNIKKVLLEAGFDMEYVYKDGDRVKTMIKQPGLPHKEEMIWSRARIVNTGFFAEIKRSTDRMDWVVSTRVDFNAADSDPLIRNGMNGQPVYENNDTRSVFVNFSFNGGLIKHLNRDNDLMLSFGRGVRSADMSERFIVLLPVGYDRFDYVGNPQLKPETNYQLDVSLEHVSKHQCHLKPSLFFSLVTDYIGSERVPPSEIRPQTKGVLGVKKFVNFDKVWLTGFEVSWTSPSDKLWHIRADMAYTYGVNPEAIGYKLENGQIVDEVTIKNDALPEIPPFELHVLLDYDLFNKKLTPSVFWRLVAPQNHISKSYGEQKSDFFQTLDVKLKYVFNQYLSVWGGVNNLFDVYYFEHLNRNIIGSSGPLYEPGRNFFVNLMFRF